jgi:hypothetical protein
LCLFYVNANGDYGWRVGNQIQTINAEDSQAYDIGTPERLKRFEPYLNKPGLQGAKTKSIITQSMNSFK